MMTNGVYTRADVWSSRFAGSPTPSSRHAHGTWSTDDVDDQFECDQLAGLQTVERRVVFEISAMKEHVTPVCDADETMDVTDGDASDRAAGARTFRYTGRSFGCAKSHTRRCRGPTYAGVCIMQSPARF